jgi:anti-sigma factor RsiW
MTPQHLTHEEINAWLDGECTTSERERAEAHIAACPQCAREAEDFRAVKNMLRTLGEAELPRSFTLPAEFAKPAPLASPTTPVTPGGAGSKVRRFEPVARIISIAAVLAFLLLGGGQLAGWIGSDSDPGVNTTLQGETNAPASALQDTEPAPARGELREQGDSAATGAGSLTTEVAHVDSQAQAESGLTPLEITTIGIGLVALAAIASWVLIHFRAGTTS